MPRVTFGLARILVGAIAVDGGMSTSLSEKFGYTVLDSVSITTEEGTVNTINIEEDDTAIISQTVAGARSVAFSTYNNEPAALLAAFGGTVTGTAPNQVWNAPDNLAPLTLSVRIESKNGVFWEMPKVELTARLNINFQKGDAARVDFSGTILKPDKAGVSAIRTGNIAA